MNPGTRFTGKWSGLVVEVMKPLGSGANGEVYLVKTPLGKAALKLCSTSGDAAMEWSLLTTLHPQGHSGPSLFPKPMVLDDGPPEAPFFYVMEWIAGRALTELYRSQDWPRVHQAASKTLAALHQLHQTNHAFCDLKPDNILVSDTAGGLSIRFVDVGGVTPFGRSVRQFTPQSDRAYFSLGSRKAEPSYDLAAFVLGLLMTWYQADMTSLAAKEPAARRAWALQAIRDFPVPGASRLFTKLLSGEISDASIALAEWTKVPSSAPVAPFRGKNKRQSTVSHSGAGGTSNTGLRSRHRKSKGARAGRNRVSSSPRKRHDWTEWVMWLSICSAATVTLVAWATFF